MAIPVVFLESAENDLRELKQYLSREFGLHTWRTSYSGIKKVIENISHFPLSGTIPEELASLGQTQYRQVVSNMNRIIYEVKSLRKKEYIYIHIIADVRKDFKSLLTRRLFQSQGLVT
jgi:toxin ParE1/3/4